MYSILKLKNKINKLAKEEKSLFKRIFDLSVSEGKLHIPPSFRNKAREYFGKRNKKNALTETTDEVIKRLETQKIIKLLNKWSGEETLFNSLRAFRPGIKTEAREAEKTKLYRAIEKTRENCDFCRPEIYTPEDTFGRVRGKYCLTAANIAKYDTYNGLVIFKKHNPLEFNREEFFDYLKTGLAWLRKAKQDKKNYPYPFIIWNCLPRAGSSRMHGHLQVLISTNYYARVSGLKKAARAYKEKYKGDYFLDLYEAHNLVGLAHSEEEIKIFSSLTPIKERETIIIGNFLDNYFKKTIFNILRCYIDEIGVTNFNLSLSLPRKGEFPCLVKIVDRGAFSKSTSDIGSMELYGSNVVANDPYTVIKAVKDFFSRKGKDGFLSKGRGNI